VRISRRQRRDGARRAQLRNRRVWPVRTTAGAGASGNATLRRGRRLTVRGVVRIAVARDVTLSDRAGAGSTRLQAPLGARESGRHGNLAFGDTVAATLGELREVGEFVLHVQHPWRIRTHERLVVGSDDLYAPSDEIASAGAADFDWDVQGANRRDRELAKRFTEWDAQRPRVLGVTADKLGGVEIELDNAVTLEPFPCASGDDVYQEFWRLLPAMTTTLS